MTNELHEYLKKMYREMPMGVFRDICAKGEKDSLHEAMMEWRKWRDTGDATAYRAFHENRSLARCIRNAVDVADTLIAEHGRDKLQGDFPDANIEEGASVLRFLLGLMEGIE